MRVLAATILAVYAKERSDTLRELLLDSDVQQFPIVLHALSAFREQAKEQLAYLVEESPIKDWSDAQKSAFAAQQANAAIALFRWGNPASLWPLLRHSPNPTLRTYLIDRLPRLAAPAASCLRVWYRKRMYRPGVRLFSIVGGIPGELRSPSLAELAADMLLAIYEDDPDAGVLFRGGMDAAKVGRGKETQIGHCTTRRGQGPRSELLARHSKRTYDDDDSWASHISNGLSHHRRASRHRRDVAYQDHPSVLRDRNDRSYGRTIPGISAWFRLFPNEISPTTDSPINVMTWLDAVAYCRWLSEEMKLPEDEMCYPPLRDIKAGMSRDNYLKRKGYRLPTEAEWEYACRAGATTSRFFGENEEMLMRYAWYIDNSSGQCWPGGLLMPNDNGLFDLLGNLKEWCHDTYRPDPLPGLDLEDYSALDVKIDRVCAGASYSDRSSVLRAANRYYNKPDILGFNVGFRIARTVSAR